MKKILIAVFLILSFASVEFTGDFNLPVNSLLAAKKKKEKTLALNFNDVEISEFTNVMSQILNKNIVLSDKVRGKISITSAREVPIEEAYDLMKSILEVKGLAVIETDNLIKIVPIKEAIKKNVEVVVDGEKITLDNENTVTYILELIHADASELLNVLRPLRSPTTYMVVYKSMNIIIFSGNAIEIRGLIKIAKSLDKKIDDSEEYLTKGASSGNIHVVHLENADALKLAEVLSRIPFSEKAVINKTPANKKIEKKQKLSIIANQETNSLIINATSSEFKEIFAVIKQLDTVRPQVLIEAKIIEVNASNNWNFGIDWSLGGKSGINQAGGSSVMGNIPTYSTPDGMDKTIVTPISPGALTLGYLADSTILNYALLSASAYDQNLNVLSTPHILTIDNQEAEINVAEEIAIPTNYRISDDNTITYTYDYKSVGIKLKLTPHITKGEKITMELLVEVNSVLGETTYTSSGSIVPPDLGKRDMNSKISVPNNMTIVVGGLMRSQQVETEVKVPVLGDIPLLGWFFKNKSVENKKTNLLIFITPKIVTDPVRIQKISQEKKLEMEKMHKNQEDGK